MKINCVKFALSSVFVLISLNALGESLTGTAIRVQGTAHLLSNGSSAAAGPQPRVKYQGQFFTYLPLKLGLKIKSGDVIHTGINGRARIAFANGDQFSVGPSTSYKYTSGGGAKGSDKSILNLYYGKLRSLISKRGENNGLKVNTSTVTAGVRGTDFYVYHNSSKGTELTVLRGLVQVSTFSSEKKSAQDSAQVSSQSSVKDSAKVSSSTSAQKSAQPSLEPDEQNSRQVSSQSVAIKSGQSVQVKILTSTASGDSKSSSQAFKGLESEKKSNSDSKKSAKDKLLYDPSVALENESDLLNKIELETEDLMKKQKDVALTVSETKKDELEQIQEVSTVKPAKGLSEISKQSDLDAKDAEKLQQILGQLEQKTVETATEDIKLHTPALFKTMQANGSKSMELDSLNKTVIDELKVKAPNDIKKKPLKEELETLGKDSYDRYFDKTKETK